jgi:cytochrome c peroxidase
MAWRFVMSKRLFIILAAIVLFSSAIPLTLNAESLDSKQLLGKQIFFAKISNPAVLSCAACHAERVGWTGPRASINKHGSVYRGAIAERFGNRKPPSSGYATLAPRFHFSTADAVLEGGNFWDGRATGWELGNPAADQAKGPFLNPVEQNNPDMKSVCEQIAASDEMASLFEEVWGKDSLNCQKSKVSETYDRIALSIAAYEDSFEVNQFTSKFDAWREGKAQLTPGEARGWDLFNGKAKCVQCHVLRHADQPGDKDLFTDFTYDNLGIPRNPENPFYRMDQVTLDDGSPINPQGAAWIDPGLGGFLEKLADPSNQSWRTLPYVTAIKGFTNARLTRLAAQNYGKQRVPTLRNLDKRPNSDFPKAYGHNGYFKSLWSIVHFYNTRDARPTCADPFTKESDALAQGCWPAPEVPDTVNHSELGDLGMTRAEENDLVRFLKTLSDGWSQ